MRGKGNCSLELSCENFCEWCERVFAFVSVFRCWASAVADDYDTCLMFHKELDSWNRGGKTEGVRFVFRLDVEVGAEEGGFGFELFGIYFGEVVDRHMYIIAERG